MEEEQEEQHQQDEEQEEEQQEEAPSRGSGCLSPLSTHGIRCCAMRTRAVPKGSPSLLITRQELQGRTSAAVLRARIATDDMLTGGTLDTVYEQLVGSGFVSAAGGGARAQLLRVNVEARHTRARARLGSSSHAHASFSLSRSWTT